jgi:DNA-binding SARP family transcriptional activator/TolB-like protein/Flp pilus assembly protein TadD
MARPYGAEMEKRDETGPMAGPGIRWSLRVLGGVDLSLAGRDGGSKLGRKEHALLAYLALHAGRPQPRAKLSGLLWGNILEESARQDLRQALSKLRQALGDPDHQLIKSVKAGGEEAVLLDAAVIDVDALQFETLARHNDLASLEAASALYAGDLLEALDVRAEGFEDWVGGERTRLRHLAIDTLVKIAGLKAEAKDTGGAIGHLESALRLDPLREDACRQVMRLHAANGRRNAALQEYGALQDLLRRELQTEPEPETAALAASIRRNSAELLSPADRAPAEARALDSPSPIAPPPPPRKRSRLSARQLLLGGGSALAGATAAALIAAGITYWRIPELAPAPLGDAILYVQEGYLGRRIIPEQPSIAVLPFVGRKDDDAGDYADAISEASASALSIVSEIRVVPQLSVLAAMDDLRKSGSVAPAAIAERLGVRYLLNGSVTKENGDITVNIELIDTKQNDSREMTETYHRQATDIISLQRDITLEIVTALQVNLTEGEQERVNRIHGTRNLEAFLAAGRGEKLLRRLIQADNLSARSYYEEATADDPDYAGAWDGLAWTYLLEARFGWTADPAGSLRKADEFARKAMALDDTRPRTYSLLGSLFLLYGDHAKAIAYGEDAVRLEANDADAAALLAYTYTYAGQPNRAATLAERAIKLRPYPPEWYLWLLGRAQRLAGRHEDAIRTLQSATNSESRSLFALVELAAAYSEAGQLPDAKQVAAKILTVSSDFSSTTWCNLVKYTDPEAAGNELAILRQAGLPE